MQPAYRTIERDATNKLKAKLITMLRNIKRESGMEENLYKAMCPTGCTSPMFYGLPKSIKLAPLRPIVLSKGSVTYGVAKVPAKIHRPLVGKSSHHIQSTKDFIKRISKVTLLPSHHIQSTKDFINRISKVTLLPRECQCAYDVTAPFTTVPIDPALNILRNYWNRILLCGTEMYYQYRT